LPVFNITTPYDPIRYRHLTNAYFYLMNLKSFFRLLTVVAAIAIVALGMSYMITVQAQNGLSLNLSNN